MKSATVVFALAATVAAVPPSAKATARPSPVASMCQWLETHLTTKNQCETFIKGALGRATDQNQPFKQCLDDRDRNISTTGPKRADLVKALCNDNDFTKALVDKRLDEDVEHCHSFADWILAAAGTECFAEQPKVL